MVAVSAAVSAAAGAVCQMTHTMGAGSVVVMVNPPEAESPEAECPEVDPQEKAAGRRYRREGGLNDGRI